MKKGEILEGKVVSTAFPNKGVVMIEDKKVVIKGALEGQVVSFAVKRNRKEKAEGRLLSVKEKSYLQDCEPKCPHFSMCGGCTYQDISYDNQLEFKAKQVKELLKDFDYEWQGIKGSPLQFEYRNKMEYSFGDEYKDGPLSLGMHKRNSFYDIVNTDKCAIVSEDYNLIVAVTLAFAKDNGYDYYRKMQHTGFLRHLVIRRSVKTNDILVNIVTSTEKEFNGEEYINCLLKLELNGKIVGILHTLNDSLSDAVVCDELKVLYGEDFIYEDILGLKFKISPFSFFQTNSLGAEVLYDTARGYVGETDNKVVFDLYSGTGTIAQILASKAKKVYGIEIIEEAVEAAKVNAKLNNLDNCEFIAGDVFEKLDEIKEKPDIIVVDPPRSGISSKALKKIADYGVNEIIYISCNPVSLAENLREFEEAGYKLVKVTCCDMFPNTGHVETVALLSRRKDEPRIQVSMPCKPD